MTPEEMAVIEAARRWARAASPASGMDSDDVLRAAIQALEATMPGECLNCAPLLAGASVSRVDGTDALVGCVDCGMKPWEPKAWDADRPGCAPETCGGSNIDPCSAVMRTEGAVHEGEELSWPLDRMWGEIAEGDRVQGSDKSWYQVLRVAEGGGPNVGRTVVTMQIGGEARPYPMSPDGEVLVKRGPAGIAVERLRAAGLSPEALR